MEYTIFDDTPLYMNPAVYHRNEKFTDIFPTANSFITEYSTNPITIEIWTEIETKMEFIYYLLYSRYGNSTIASSDTTRFKFDLATRLYTNAPLWLKETEIQKSLRALTLEDAREGSTAIYNAAYNPETAPTTNTTEELDYINSQNVSKHKKDKVNGYLSLMDAISRDHTKEFLDKFQTLFLTVVIGECPIPYCTPENAASNNNG